MATSSSLELEALIRPVSALLLEVRGLLLRSTNLPGIERLREDTPSPPSSTTTTSIMETKVISLKSVTKVKNDTTSLKAPQHPHPTHKTPEHTANPLNIPDDTPRKAMKHNIILKLLDSPEKPNNAAHALEDFIISKLTKLHLVPLRKHSEKVPPDEMHTEDSESTKTKRHALPTRNTPEDPASQNPRSNKIHDLQGSANTTNPESPEAISNKIPHKNEPQENTESTESHEKERVTKGKGSKLDIEANDDPHRTEKLNSHEDAPKSSSQNTLESPLEPTSQMIELGGPLT